MSTLELLRAARARIEKPEAWTQGCGARMANGDPAPRRTRLRRNTNSPPQRVRDTDCTPRGLADTAVDALRATAGMGVSIFNDTRTHAEVLDLFDRTIARLEAE